MRRRLRLVTWNVGRLYSPTHNNRLDDADVPRVAHVLGELDPDVALLQELVDVRQLDAITTRLSAVRGPFAGRLARQCAYDRRTAALVRADREPAFDEHVLDESRRATVMASFDLGGGARGAAFSAHFDVYSTEKRAEQGCRLAELAEARHEPLVVAAGDFNLDPRWAAGVGNRRDVATFGRMTRALVDAGREAGATLVGLWRVDHVLVRGAVRHLVRVSPRRLPLGDHAPLVLDVDLDPDVASAS
jgi:endonuclease/exonuclease/phosphatase family metal-dependent hydrolase